MTPDEIAPRTCTTPDRRGVLLLLGWLGILGLEPLLAPAVHARPVRRDPMAARLHALIPHTDSAAVVGREYLRIAPDEREIGRLARLISAHCGDRVLEAEPGEVRRCVDRHIRWDFDEEQVVTLHGWMVSRTEARLCALLALCLEPEGVND